MRRFSHNYSVFFLIIALIILFSCLFVCISVACLLLDGVYFFIAWMIINVIGGGLLIKIIDLYEDNQIMRYHTNKKNKQLDTMKSKIKKLWTKRDNNFH